MERVTIADAEAYVSAGDVFRPLTDALGVEGFAVNYYELAPGESFGYCYHRHRDQEEVFYVRSGTATFETEDGEIDVAAGELVRFAPGEWQRGTNAGEDRVVALALGAPRGTDEIDLQRECSACGGRTPHEVSAEDGGAVVVARCLDCGAETGRFAE